MIAILAGSGQLPADVYRSLSQQNKPFVIITCDPLAITPSDVPVLIHHTQWGKVGAFIDFLHKHKVRQIVLAGAVSRPNITDLKFDWQGLQWINSLRSSWSQGDDGLLRGVMALLEKEGFDIIAPHDLLESAAPSVVTKLKPSPDDLMSIQIGQNVLKALSPFDIGQSVIVAGERILGVEGPEGTDALIQRCATFTDSKQAILVKMAKIGQSLKVDKPTLGSQTVLKLIEHSFKGVAFEQRSTHIIDADCMVTLADKHGLFIHFFN